ncbi:MAG: hypothetical protein ACRCVI_01815 [Mycoplasmoidaceae bacterium]
MEDKIQDKIDEIVKKKFRKNLKAGYDAYEVDKFFDYVNNFLLSVSNEFENFRRNEQKLKNDKKELQLRVDKREKKILLLENEINELKDNGYHHQKIIKDVSSLKNDFAKIKNGDK